MQISINCIELIKRWEGLRLKAYIDPVGVPTIGYGTTYYPTNGKKVQLGDQITAQQAEAFLKMECDEIAERVSRLVNVSLNQNQFDALISFCYNLGTGSLQTSTLLEKLNQGNFAAAAEEFKKWVKGEINGVLEIIPGLVKRRKDEEDLFRKNGEEGQPIGSEKALQDQVTLLEGFRDENGKTVIVAWSGGEVVEILALERNIKDDLISVLGQYRKAQNFHFAPVDKKIPAGERIAVSGKASALTNDAERPTLAQILVRGSEGEDVKTLQRRLKDLGYYRGDVDGIFGKATDEAAKAFQTDVFGIAEADGKVGPRTWEKLWGERTATVSHERVSSTTPNYLRLTKTNRKDPDGCYKLKLDYIKDRQGQGSIEVCSGGPSHQYFRTGSQSRALSYEPLPEGKWYINNIEWKDGVDNYSGRIFESGIGPVSVPLDYVAPGQTARSAIEIHIDWNKGAAPGTAGCIGVASIADYKKLVSWLRDTDPRDLYVDWGLGTCPKP